MFEGQTNAHPTYGNPGILAQGMLRYKILSGMIAPALIHEFSTLNA